MTPSLLFAALTLLAPPAWNPPRLEVEPPGRVELGSLGPREAREQPYVFRNTSQAPISLRVLDLAPGVTVRGPALAGPIPPGAGAALTLRLDPSDWVGFQKRNVRLGTDDPGQGNYYLPVEATVRPDLAVDGPRREFGTVACFESPRQVFHFVRETGEPLALALASPLPPYVEGEVEAEGSRATLTFTLRPAGIQPGVELGLERIRVETNAPLQPGFDLYLGWRLRHAIEAEPARLVFQDPARPALSLTLTAMDGQPFRVLGARVEGEGFAPGPLPVGAAPVQVLEVRRTAGATSRAMLVLTFQGPESERRIPLAYLP